MRCLLLNSSTRYIIACFPANKKTFPHPVNLLLAHQFYKKRRAFAFSFGLGPDFAVVGFHHFLGDIQADAVAVGVGFLHVFGAIEFLEGGIAFVNYSAMCYYSYHINQTK